MARLPTSNGDTDQWGEILNQFLLVSHRPDGRPKEIPGSVNISDYGADPTGRHDSTPAIREALAALGEANSSDGANGGIVRFPKGIFKISRLDINDHANVTFEGVGSRYAENFKTPETALFYEADGSESEEEYALKLATNFARGWRFRNLHLAYTNPTGQFKGNLIRVETPGVQFENVSFGDMSVYGPEANYSAHALVLVTNAEFVNFTRCTFDMSQRGIWIPSASMMSNVAVTRDCVFYDCRYAAVEYESGGNHGLLMEGCAIDPIRQQPVYGIIIKVNGYVITGCAFAGTSTAVSAKENFAWLQGRGVFQGNVILTAATGVEISGVADLRGNYINAKRPVNIRGGSVVTGRANEYAGAASGDHAVEIANPYDGAVSVSMGPDRVDASFAHSYYVGSSRPQVYGEISYDPFQDASQNGPRLNANMSLMQLRRRVLDKAENYALNKQDHQCTLTNAAATSAVTFTLPQAEPGLEFTFVNLANHPLTISAQADDRVLSLGSGGSLSITNNSERNAMLRLRAIDRTRWLPEVLAGQWT